MVQEKFDRGISQLMSIEVLFNAEPIDHAAQGSLMELAQARLAFDKKGRCVKDNHTSIIGRQELVEGLLKEAEMHLSALYSDPKIRDLCQRIEEAIAP